MLDQITSEASSALIPFLLRSLPCCFIILNIYCTFFTLPHFPSFKFSYYDFSSLMNWQRTEGDWGSCSPDLNFEEGRMCHRHSRDLQQDWSAVWVCDASLLFHCPHCLLQLFVELPNWIFKVNEPVCWKTLGCRK